LDLDGPDEFVARPKSFAVRRGEKLTIRVVRVTREPQPAAVGPAAPADVGWTDLIPLVDPLVASETGRVTRDEGGPRPALLVTSADGPFARIRLPFQPADSYEVRATLARTDGQNAFVLVLPVPGEFGAGGAPGMGRGMLIDGGGPFPEEPDARPNVALYVDEDLREGGWSGVRTVGSQPRGADMSRILGERLQPGRPYRLYARVTAARGKVAIRAELNGKVLVDWSGRADNLHGGTWWATSDNSRLALGAIGGTYRVEQLDARALPGTGAAASFAAPALTLVGRVDAPWTNLAPFVDPTADREQGELTRENHDGDDVLRVKDIGGSARVVLPVRPTGNYEIRARIARAEGDGPFNLMLPVPGTEGRKQVGLYLDGPTDGGISGLDWRDGPLMNITKTKFGARMARGRAHDLLVLVSTHEGQCHVQAELDGKPVFWWGGRLEDVRSGTTISTANRRFVGFGTAAGAFRVERFDFRMTYGSAVLGRPAGPVKAPAAPAPLTLHGKPNAPWTDLLPGVHIPTHRLDGTWGVQGGTQTTSLVAGDAKSERGRLALPVWPKGDYELRLRFARTAGNECLAVMLPIPGVAGGQNALVVDGYKTQGKWISKTGWAGLEFVKDGPVGSHIEAALGKPLANDTAYTLLVRVTAKGPTAAVRAEIDGTKVVDWTGPAGDLTPSRDWFTPDRGQLGLGVWDHCQFRIDAVEFRPLTGTAEWKPGRTAPAAAAKAG
jgi:hypothetical protein